MFRLRRSGRGLWGQVSDEAHGRSVRRRRAAAEQPRGASGRPGRRPAKLGRFRPRPRERSQCDTAFDWYALEERPLTLSSTWSHRISRSRVPCRIGPPAGSRRMGPERPPVLLGPPWSAAKTATELLEKSGGVYGTRNLLKPNTQLGDDARQFVVSPSKSVAWEGIRYAVGHREPSIFVRGFGDSLETVWRRFPGGPPSKRLLGALVSRGWTSRLSRCDCA